MDTAVILFIYLAIGWPVAKHLMKKGRQDDASILKKILEVNCRNKEDTVVTFVALWMFWPAWIFFYYLEKIFQWGGEIIYKKIQKL